MRGAKPCSLEACGAPLRPKPVRMVALMISGICARAALEREEPKEWPIRTRDEGCLIWGEV